MADDIDYNKPVQFAGEREPGPGAQTMGEMPPGFPDVDPKGLTPGEQEMMDRFVNRAMAVMEKLIGHALEEIRRDPVAGLARLIVDVLFKAREAASAAGIEVPAGLMLAAAKEPVEMALDAAREAGIDVSEEAMKAAIFQGVGLAAQRLADDGVQMAEPMKQLQKLGGMLGGGQ